RSASPRTFTCSGSSACADRCRSSCCSRTTGRSSGWRRRARSSRTRRNGEERKGNARPDQRTSTSKDDVLPSGQRDVLGETKSLKLVEAIGDLAVCPDHGDVVHVAKALEALEVAFLNGLNGAQMREVQLSTERPKILGRKASGVASAADSSS